MQSILKILARRTLWRYRPFIAGITGSVGKTSTKEAIFAVLKSKFVVRTSEKNYNNEFGLPLTILGIRHGGRNPFKWLLMLFGALNTAFFRRKSYPEVLLLEYGVDRPGDMDYLLSIAKPDLAVVTAIGEIPVHVEFFKDPEEVVKEKAKLVSALPPDGYAVLNHDDVAVYDMKRQTVAESLTYGFEEHADLRIINYEPHLTKDEEWGDMPLGISLKLEYNGSVVPVRLRDVFGEAQAYAVSAACAAGLVMNINLVEASEALRDYTSTPGRLRLLRGVKHTLVLDDTYNAAPESMRAALDTLKSLPAHRKVAVLGDMLEIGRYAEQAHRAIGDQAAEFVDLLLCVGPRAKFIAEEALTRGVEPHARRLMPGQVLKFDDSISAGKALDPLIREGDLILVKGSQAMRMERVVREVMAHPEKAEELLVRQDEYWKDRP